MELGRAKRLALDLLARREYSRHELREKLIYKGCLAELADEVIADLEAGELVSDVRFAETLARVRRERGYGPLRIRKEMQDKGLGAEIIEQCLDPNDSQWLEDIQRVRRKKFGTSVPKDYQQRARQARFLQYRGFTFDQIQRVLSAGDVESV
ncbi:MAG: regulatory protein RecX [Acidiferrobacterales bacterium]